MSDNFSKALNYQKELRSIINDGITITVNNKNFTLNPNTIMYLEQQRSFGKEKIAFHADGELCIEYTDGEIQEIFNEYTHKINILTEEANTLAWSTVHIDQSKKKISLRDILKEKGLI